MSDEIEKHEQQNNRALFKADSGGALRPANLAEAIELSKLLSQSAFVPSDYQGKPGNVLAALQMGAEVGLSPMASLQNIAVINGRPSVWGDAALAICQSHPGWGGIDEDVTDERAVCTVWRIERTAEGPTKRTIQRTFSTADAKRAGLADKSGPWKQYPRRMLQMRARAFALRDAFADALKGLSVREETRDYVDTTAVEVRDADPAPAATRGTEAVREKLRRRKGGDAGIPDAAQKWIAALNTAPDTDDVAAIARDFAEVERDLSDEARAAVSAAFEAAAARLAG